MSRVIASDRRPGAALRPPPPRGGSGRGSMCPNQTPQPLPTRGRGGACCGETDGATPESVIFGSASIFLIGSPGRAGRDQTTLRWKIGPARCATVPRAPVPQKARSFGPPRGSRHRCSAAGPMGLAKGTAQGNPHFKGPATPPLAPSGQPAPANAAAPPPASAPAHLSGG